MTRRTNAFYFELRKTRAKIGEKEYDRDEELRPEVVKLLRKHGTTEDELLLHEADKILDSLEKSEESVGQGEFWDETHVALGEKKRCRRDSLTLEMCFRRKKIIDHNKAAQDAAWAAETQWLNDEMDGLAERPPGTTIKQARALMKKAASA